MRDYDRTAMLRIKKGDIIKLDGYPDFIAEENHRKYDYVLCTSGDKIRYADIDEVRKPDPDTGEYRVCYSAFGRDKEMIALGERMFKDENSYNC